MQYLVSVVYSFLFARLQTPVFLTVWDMIDNLFTNWGKGILQSAFSDDAIKSASDLLMLSKDKFDTLFGVASTAFGTVLPVGFALLTTFFLIHMFDMASKEQMTVESLAKAMIGLVIAVGIIGNLTTIINSLLSIGDGLTDSIVKNVTYNSADKFDVDGIVDTLTNDEGMQGFFLCVSAIFVYLCHQIAMIMIYMAAITRALDIAWRVALAPIAAANAFEGGANSTAMRYLKSLFGAILAGAAMVIIFAGGSALSLSLFGDTDYSGISRLLMSCATMFSTGMAAMGASAKVKEVCG